MEKAIVEIMFCRNGRMTRVNLTTFPDVQASIHGDLVLCEMEIVGRVAQALREQQGHFNEDLKAQAQMDQEEKFFGPRP